MPRIDDFSRDGICFMAPSDGVEEGSKIRLLFTKPAEGKLTFYMQVIDRDGKMIHYGATVNASQTNLTFAAPVDLNQKNRRDPVGNPTFNVDLSKFYPGCTFYFFTYQHSSGPRLAYSVILNNKFVIYATTMDTQQVAITLSTPIDLNS